MAEVKRVGGRKGSLKTKPRRETHHVSIAADVSKKLVELHEKSGKTVSTIVETALRDAFLLWDQSRAQRITLDEDLTHLKEVVGRIDQRVLTLIAKQNLDGLIAYPSGAPIPMPRAPETWGEWQGTLRRIRYEIESSETGGN